MNRHPARRGSGGVAVAVIILGLIILALAWAGIGGTLADAAAQDYPDPDTVEPCPPGEYPRVIVDRRGNVVGVVCVPTRSREGDPAPDCLDGSPAERDPAAKGPVVFTCSGATPTRDGYGGQPARATPTGSLPFTGLDVALLVFSGFLLLTVGMMLRRLRRGGAR